MEESRHRVCVIGGAGYVGSSLVKKLIDEGHTVHATLRSLSEESKVGLLKSFAGADERLKLFEADLFNKSEQIEQAIHGCEFVFLVATPTPQARRLNVDAIVEGVKNVAYACSRCGSVRKLIYTASTGAASPLKEDGNGFKGVMDETCWTPLPLPFHHCDHSLGDYIESKTLAEKEMLKIGNDEGLEVVSLALGVVGGNTCLWYCPYTLSIFFSQLTGDKSGQSSLKFVEDLLGKIAVVHIEDVCDAHIFAMKAPNGSMSGRFLCTNSFVSAAEIANYLRQNYPEFNLNLRDQDCSRCMMNGPEGQVVLNYEKLLHKGFTYKKSWKDVIDDSVSCGRRFRHL
ncbi:PREDICTED: anthocyanidin reductase ((2S)-flavan-3-ol-forming)-like isoform X2 [Ipomoea nil]|uniref:anthocyanidin reductase ((2S)-flavan-3-ol-forming)-like isoform X2 n=1 Tax=Ipomoea nil TaxID=35883 RepID=UPI000900ECEE|nr:PREDICTED: anthocyanidin reductase ((2S)-flavan-3-ol-forming)-like isoform X2 [Ipomoea nil]